VDEWFPWAKGLGLVVRGEEVAITHLVERVKPHAGDRPTRRQALDLEDVVSEHFPLLAARRPLLVVKGTHVTRGRGPRALDEQVDRAEQVLGRHALERRPPAGDEILAGLGFGACRRRVTCNRSPRAVQWSAQSIACYRSRAPRP
jgi:hypothetical protein